MELEKNNFDPVEEYNRTIEEFMMNNSFQNIDDFVIFLSNFFSFFQEYGDIECPKVKIFRNYPLISEESFNDIFLRTELERYSDVLNPFPVSPIFPNEKFLIEEVRKDLIREKIRKEENDLQPVKTSNFHYKRWL